MYIAIMVLITIVSTVLMIAVLVQKPKGNGLGVQLVPVKNKQIDIRKANKFIGKSTWVLVFALFTLCLSSTAFLA